MGEAHLIHLSLGLLQSPIAGHVALRGNSWTGSRTDTLERNWRWPKVEISQYYTFNGDVFIFCSSFFKGFQFWNPSCLVMLHSSLKLMSILFSCPAFKSILRIVLLPSYGKKVYREEVTGRLVLGSKRTVPFISKAQLYNHGFMFNYLWSNAPGSHQSFSDDHSHIPVTTLGSILCHTFHSDRCPL